jgi:hypothetical protein
LNRVEILRVRAFRGFALLILCIVSPSLLRSQSRLDDFVAEVIQRSTGHCGSDAAFEVARERHAKAVRILDVGPVLQDSILSPSGRFKVFYDHTGKNVATPEYAAYVAAIADTAYFMEVDTLG